MRIVFWLVLTGADSAGSVSNFMTGDTFFGAFCLVGTLCALALAVEAAYELEEKDG